MKKGETFFISAAAGAVGQLVRVYREVMIDGLHVVGSASDDAKVKFLIEECGFDAAFNYKTTDTTKALVEYCPKGIAIYFENVGGKTLEAVINHANNFARIIACGMISQYNLEKPEPVHNLMQVVRKRLRIEGFIVSDLAAEYGADFTREEDVAVGIENAPEAFIGMLKGKNFGR
ncbi:hypothetical protein BC938DRAFT_472857 [Jimgerdemannia flammicorona]|uniref:Alcohol dehydrogenase-like C-terminal domain-containing protein n=1 Tax=Jimgerdemannia flammicorona TaxID=994334 RepID=A0A433QZU6_9FUNG|nr:hypothetical protein BC938DRAFT_472857 [Jimgerdemannia flammicorona]